MGRLVHNACAIITVALVSSEAKKVAKMLKVAFGIADHGLMLEVVDG
jgi:hypothetical protein